ncbi:methyltransferase domain-containing protein [Halomonas piscis]|uniref:Malonyl-[acyl-carrier protein] O-methyltransferase n=1 Tax=Halomonas piscis TaxID=3031727 RepID=A0ABY9Z126_9GAMM|nr:methyltransferase domain-containing protein [Halomonas piscis]WNK20823.1 methyltransferase domain-containing protein [Halomonas piscis]
MSTLALNDGGPATTHDWQARVARAFSRAAAHYDRRASAQRHIGQALWQYLPASAASVVDVGCATGDWTRKLAERYPDAEVMGVDIAPGMLLEARKRGGRVRFREGSAEALPVTAQSVELIFSNLALQWCRDTSAVMAEFARVLAPGGRAVFTTLLDGTLEEIGAAFQRPQALLAYADRDTHLHAAAAAGLRVSHERSHLERFYYPDMAAVLASIKGVGAQVARPQSAGLTRRDLKAATARMEARRTPEGLPVSYRCFTLVLERP